MKAESGTELILHKTLSNDFLVSMASIVCHPISQTIKQPPSASGLCALHYRRLIFYARLTCPYVIPEHLSSNTPCE